MNFKLKTLIFFLFTCSFTFAQNYSIDDQEQIDKYNEILISNSSDTSKIDAYLQLTEIIYVNNIDTVYYLNNKVIKLCEKGLSKENTDELKYFYKKSIASAYNNIGFVDNYHGKIQLSLSNYKKGLKINQEINNLDGLSSAYINLGFVYSDLGDTSKSMEYYLKSLELNIELNDSSGMATSYNNIGSLYLVHGDFEKSLLYNNKSLTIRELLNDKYRQAISLNNIGGTYEDMQEYDLALNYFNRSLELYTQVESKDGIAHEYLKIAQILYNKGKISESKEYAQKSYNISSKLGYVLDIKKSAELLSKIYEDLGNYKRAFFFNHEYIILKDSLNNQNVIRENILQQSKFEYEKQMVADSIKQAELYNAKLLIEQNKLIESQEKKKILYVGVILLLILLFFIFRRYRISQSQKKYIEKQKIIVENQHHQLEETHQEISDSIQYAKRLQKAIFPSAKQIEDSFNDAFVFFKPKDVVSGDFYWLFNKDNKTFFAAADCTGHGVPGAMVSFVCSEALNQTIKDFKLDSTSEILNKTRDLVIDVFSRSGENIKDGMDIALCCIDNDELIFSGANNPLWIIRDTKQLSKEQLENKNILVYNNKALIELKSDRQPVGLYSGMKDFTQQKIQLIKNDTIFIFTDGFADQFGGEKGKKLKYKPFKRLLLELSDLSPKEIETQLDVFFTNWKKDFEQIDDVCIFGVRV